MHETVNMHEEICDSRTQAEFYHMLCASSEIRISIPATHTHVQLRKG